MVVDDNKNFLPFVEIILKAPGLWRIELVQEPVSAIDNLIKRLSDLVLCDWEIGDMNGVVFSQKS